MNTIEKLEQQEIEHLTQEKTIPEFSPGDTLKVSLWIKEGERKRIQIFQGVCIARKNGRKLGASFSVLKVSLGEGVERVFPLYSPLIDSIEVVRYGKVRRAKLYYLRHRRGKAARITERTTGRGMAKSMARKKEREQARLNKKQTQAEQKKTVNKDEKPTES